jgi:hypothetical protein
VITRDRLVVALCAAVPLASLVACETGSPEKVWSIGIFEAASPLELAPAPSITNPVLTAADVTDVPASFVADPFLLRHEGAWLMFFEVFNARDRQGDVGLATSDDGLHWNYEGIVLDEPFSVSYPQVFRWEGAFYMLPETHEAGEVRLYRAQAFPQRWEPDAVLLRGDLVDPTLVTHAEQLWLFAEANPEGNDRLRLFGANALRGPWREHPRSPIVDGDATRARPAGAVIRHASRLLRPVQVDVPDYGVRVRWFEILALDSASFAEREVMAATTLRASGSGWAAGGMHHVSAIEAADGLWRAAVDGYYYPEPTRP